MIKKEKDQNLIIFTHPIIKIKKTIGQKAADNLTKFIGSWKFLVIFGGILIIWIIVNTTLIISKKWDPYPFILLNLVLSCLTAIQAPIILMSQNREAEKERLKLQYDYELNKKSEKEIEEIKKQLNRIERKLN
jgi:uncharacterized membrane protein